MLPTLAERLREQQAKSRSRPVARAPWPVPSEPPTALLFQAPPEPAASEPAPVVAAPARARTAQAEVLLLLFWALLVLIDGVLALVALIQRVAPRVGSQQGRSGSAPAEASPLRGGSWAWAATP